tara:strand:- start:347 stop:1042 length:696 start_codon:yes stop_codon:yes gene_type:complete
MLTFRTFSIAFLALALSGCQLVPGQAGGSGKTRAGATATSGAGPSSGFGSSLTGAQCLARLSTTGAEFSPLPSQSFGRGCTQIESVSLGGLMGDTTSFGIDNIGAVTCEAANAFAGWVRFGVDRAARAYLGSPLARIETMGSYACRNIAGSNKRSAHARAEAIDVAAFVLEDGRRIRIDGDWDGGTEAERQFLRVVKKSACKRFGTVLSPEYNAAHADHLHLEVGSGSFCR